MEVLRRMRDICGGKCAYWYVTYVTSREVRELATEVFGIPPKSDETIPTTKSHPTRPHTTAQPEPSKASALHRKYVCLLFLKKVYL